MSEPNEYLEERIRHALAEDPALAELGVEVTVEGDVLVLRGTVSSKASREKCERLAAEILPEHPVRNELDVKDLQEPEGPSP